MSDQQKQKQDQEQEREQVHEQPAAPTAEQRVNMTDREAEARVAGEQDEAVLREMHRRSRRSFLVGGIAIAGAYGFWRWAGHGELDGLPRPLRRAEQWNERVSRTLLGDRRLAPTFASAKAVPEMRLNGDIGLDPYLELASWRLQVTGLARPGAYPQSVPDVAAWQYESDSDEMTDAPDNSTDGGGGIPQTPPDDTKSQPGGAKGNGSGAPANIGTTTVTVNGDANGPAAPGAQPGVLLTLADLRTLPHVEQTFQFKCIEGWSQIVQCGGVRLADLVARYQPRRNAQGRLPRYVGLETPKADYYVGLYMEDALHPQTLLCYEINGQPLSMEHGAPLRLVIPVKYGIKHLKQIGRITFTDRRPPDYWAEQGYDWYAGH